MKRNILIPVAVATFMPMALHAEIVDLALDASVAIGSTGTSNVSALYDNDKSTGVTFATGTYITWESKVPYSITEYVIVGGGNADTNPRAWALEGSNDGASWTQIDRKTAQTVAAEAERRIVLVEAKQMPYRYFRFNVESVKNKGSQCTIAELRLYGEKGEMVVAPSDIRYKASDAGLVLGWRDNSNNETGFIVERSLTGTDFSEIAEVSADVTKYVDANVPTGVGALYRVCAVKNRVKSEYSSTGVVRTGEPSDMPSVTANVGYSVVGTNPINDNENGAKAVDGNLFTKYLSLSLPATLTVKLQEPVVATQYAVASANDAAERDPRNWAMEGSNDGVNWIVIDEKENQYFSSRFQTNRYRITNTMAYSYYRLRVTANQGDRYMQLSEFALFGDVEPSVVADGLVAPQDLAINVRTYNQVELAWSDNNSIEDCYVIERSTDGENWDRQYVTQPNDQRCYPYSLKANTTYYFRIAAKRGNVMSEWSSVVSATTPTDEWPETWPNFNFDYGYHTGNLVKVYSNDDIAIFVNPEDVNAEGVSMVDLDLSWMYEPYTKMWVAIRETYKNEYGEYLVSDPKLYIVPHYHYEGGGLGRLYHYRDSEQLFRNIVHVSVGKDSGWRWEQNPGNSGTGFLYDCMSHECGHIIEGVGSGYKNSPFYPVWLDSKWAEIFQYDIFGKMDPVHQAAWHKEYMILGAHTEKSPAPGSEWYINWLYPTYRDFGGDKLFQRFFALLGEHYFKRDGELQGSGNLGEYIHFMSGAAGVDVTSYAKNAFGWCDEWAMQLIEARNRYPGVTYEEANAEGNLLTMPEAVLTTDAVGVATLPMLTDGDYKTVFDASNAGTDKEWIEIVYRGNGHSSLVKSYKLVTVSNKNPRPLGLELLGSNDGETWTLVDEHASIEWDSDNSFEQILDEHQCYSQFKLRLKAFVNKRVSMQLYEWELFGSLTVDCPTDLRGEWNGSEVKLSWSAPYEGIDKFEVERANVNDREFAKIGEVDVIDLVYIDDDVLPNNSYLYRVREVGENFVSPYSNVLEVTIGQSGIQTITTDASSIPTLLDLYPTNCVNFYTVDGVCVVSKSISSSEWKSLLSGDGLKRGVYIVTADFNGAIATVHIKVVVK